MDRRRSGWNSGGNMASAEGGSVPSGIGYGERCTLRSRLGDPGKRLPAPRPPAPRSAPLRFSATLAHRSAPLHPIFGPLRSVFRSAYAPLTLRSRSAHMLWNSELVPVEILSLRPLHVFFACNLNWFLCACAPVASVLGFPVRHLRVVAILVVWFVVV